MKSSVSIQKVSSNTFAYFLLFLIFVLLVTVILIYIFQTNIVDDGNGTAATLGTITSSNYQTAYKIDVTKSLHVISPPLTSSSKRNNFYLPPGRHNGDVITFILNTPSTGTFSPEKVQIWIDNCKNNNASFTNSYWAAFATTYTPVSTPIYLNTGAICRAIWYNNYWYLSNNSVNFNT